jgi:hypothetical protein
MARLHDLRDIQRGAVERDRAAPRAGSMRTRERIW